MHNHEHCHHEFKYCSICDIVYCSKCSKEWAKVWSTITSTYPYSTGTSGDITLCKNTATNSGLSPEATKRSKEHNHQ